MVQIKKIKPFRIHFQNRLLQLASVLLVCGCERYSILDPKGPISHDIRFLLVVSACLMLLVVVPVIVMSLWFPFRYRSSNSRSPYDSQWNRSRKIEVVVWFVPVLIVCALSAFLYKYTHKLDPYKPLPGADPIAIQAISLDWKWLFIYPAENVAAVNQMAFPVQTPLNFRLTSATVMTSLFIPQLGSQMYAMAGMQTRLNLLANQAGDYAGQNQQFSGSGYSGMFFVARALPLQQYVEWIETARQSPDTLSWAAYCKLLVPSSGDSIRFFGAVEPGLFDSVICSFNPSMRTMIGCTFADSISAPHKADHCWKPETTHVR